MVIFQAGNLIPTISVAIFLMDTRLVITFKMLLFSPNCGKKLKSKTTRMDNNKRLAAMIFSVLYFLGYGYHKKKYKNPASKPRYPALEPEIKIVKTNRRNNAPYNRFCFLSCFWMKNVMNKIRNNFSHWFLLIKIAKRTEKIKKNKRFSTPPDLVGEANMLKLTSCENMVAIIKVIKNTARMSIGR